MTSGILHIASITILTISLNCCTCISKNDTGQEQLNKEIKPLPENPLPPGSADIEAWIQDFREGEDSFLCKVKVSNVNSYGPSTPPLPQGYVFTLDVPKSLLEKNKYEADKIFVIGKLLKMRVRYQRTVPDGGSSERWIAINFSNLNK